ncbi:protein kinase domain-containing protein [Modestobacter altitudinis]|uniref:protein kinase domain-containing protein n=1 Tax=Modestobacter altitudinis TaxID=2213158 RepID=UPI00110CA1C6|nr:protein kinase [Modestobacter altitudinis]
MTPRMFGPYELLDLLGRGGMGDVYRARDTRRGRLVALKLLPDLYTDDAEYLSRFRREQLVAARLREPHVIPIHDFGEIDGRLFIDMRLVDGEHVGRLLERTGPLPPARAVHLVGQVAEALAAAHADGLVHRDVKPTNVLVTPSDFVYVVDFGIARKIGTTSTALTVSGATVGTLDYMAPERFTNLPVDARADVYSLACLLHECLTDTRPFRGDDLPALMHAHLYGTPARVSSLVPGIPPALDAVVARGLAKDREDRYPGPLELAAAAREALRTTEPLPQAPPVLPAGRVVPTDPRPAERTEERTEERTGERTTAVASAGLPTPGPDDHRDGGGPGGAGASGGRPARRRALAVAGAVAAVLAVVLAVTWALTTRGDDPQDGAAAGTSTSATSPSAPASPTPTAPVVSPSVPIPAAGAAIDVGPTPGYAQVAPNGRYAYIASRDERVVTVLDTTLDRVTGKIPIDAAPPRFITFSPDGRTAYVTVYTDDKTVNAVVFLDTATNRVSTTVPVGKRPFAPATTLDGRFLYVPIHDEGRVEVIDTTTGEIVDRLTTPPNPHWVVFSRDGGTFYTADHESGVVTAFDTASHALLATIEVGVSPHSLALSPDGGQLSVVNYDSNTLSMIDTATHTVVRTVDLGNNPQDVTYAPDGVHLYTADVEAGLVEVVETATGRVTARIPTGDSPSSVSVTPDGRRAYVTNLGDGTVRVLDTAAL